MPLLCLSSLFFHDQLVRWINAQLVLNHLPRDPRHIQNLPCKDIKIVLEKSDESEFYLGSRLLLIQSFLSELLGSTTTSLSSISRVPFSLLSAF
jgi:hypothetical protein